jgi:hypothetical protein
MSLHHVIAAVLILAAGYYIGVHYPQGIKWLG